jgi:SNF2 family DNA or RNA helicase
MTTLHGNWISRSGDGAFFLWGERWRALESLATEADSSHPFCVDSAELISYLLSYKVPLDRAIASIEPVTLPSYSPPRKKYLLPLLSEQSLALPPQSLSLRVWQVSGIYLDASTTARLLAKLPLGTVREIGSDLRFWLHIHRWSLDLLARGKFLPGLAKLPDQSLVSQWYPLLDSTLDRSRLVRFLQTIPPIAQAYPGGEDPRTMILDFLRTVIDARLRDLIDQKVTFSPSLFTRPWLQSLLGKERSIALEPNVFQRLQNAYANWTFPIQEDLVTLENKPSIDNHYRVCFSLQPPQADSENWTVTYSLQALDDESLLISARSIWAESDQYYQAGDRAIDRPQEILLKGLGLASQIHPSIAISLEESHPVECSLGPIQAYEFIRSIAWQLQDRGLGVILPIGLAPGSNEKRMGIKIEAAVTPKKGERLSLKSLLNFQLKLVVGGQEISKKDFEKMLDKKSPLVEVDGQWLMLQPTDVKAAREILNNTIEPINLSVEDALRLSSGDSNVIAKLPVVNFEATGTLQELIENLTNNQGVKLIPTPKAFQGELRPYQIKGISWLSFLEQWGLGACLADDMGLGKTPQLIAFLLSLQERDLLVNPVLVVCPTSVVNNWEREVRKFAPKLSILVHHGEKRSKGRTFAREIQNKALVITSYPLVFRDETTLEAISWQGVVLDEAQNIKNASAKQSRSVRKLKAGFRIALTGTPVENRLSELWSILDFLNPNFLGTQAFFQRRFAIPIEKYGDRDSLQTLRSLVRPFILRRLKTDKSIIQDLPEKQEMNVFCGLSKEQAEIYQTLTSQTLEKIEDSEGIQRRGLILTLLMQLKQICNHPAQFLKEKQLVSAGRSGKLLRLEEMLEELVEEGDRALIFTQFAEWGKLLQPYLQKKLKREVLFLYGSTKQKERVEMVDRFQNDPDGPPIFLLSLKAGGTGLNLTRANHVFHIDRWWNPAVENQATDRAFRIGQKRDVQVHKFICTGTLEERINDMIEGKKQLAEQTVDAGENWLTDLDTDRLRDLLLLDRAAIIDEGEG